MPLPVPSYLQVPGIQDAVIRYYWDDWNVEAVEMPLDESLQERLHRISQRAVAALTVAIAEWVVYRFAALSTDPTPALRLEAAWAQIVDSRYSPHRDTDINDWRGPVRGPLGTVIRRAIFAIDQAEIGGEPAWRAGSASKIAEHVLPDALPYLRWRDDVLDGFEELYPIDPDETLGDVVPREALDPAAAFEPADTESVISRLLARLDARANPFLSSPSQMLEMGFVGTPYVFSMEADRKRRYEW